LLNNGDPHKAIASLERLLERFPEFAVAHNDLGVLFYHTGNKEKAQRRYERAVELMPDNINFQKNLADFYCVELGRIEDALQIYVSILKADPQDIETLLATGQICKALEKFDDAGHFFKRILEIEPWNADARDQIEEMEKQCTGGSLSSESVEDAYRRLHEKLNILTPAEAIIELEKLVEGYPDFAVGHNDLAVLCCNTGDKEKALRHYRLAAHLQPGNIALQKNLADFLFVDLGEVEEALQIYLGILETHPDDVETLLIAGHICVALKKLDDAKGFYERVISLEPDNEDASKNLQVIIKRQIEQLSARLNSLNDATPSTATLESRDLYTEEPEKKAAEHKTTASIVISLDGIQNRVKECLKSIQTHTPEPHELLLVTRGATKGMLKWAQQLVKDNDHYHIIECVGHKSWTECINQAILKAGGNIIVLMHNDVVLSDGWLNVFVRCINFEPDCGVVGPISNRAAGIQQIVHLEDSDRAEFETAAKAFYEQNQYRRVATPKLSDVCLAFRRDLIDNIGDFDELFISEEVAVEDFCTRAVSAGFQNLIAADLYVFHYDRHLVKNNVSTKKPAGAEDRKKYQEKWNSVQNPEAKAFQMVQLLARADEFVQSGKIDAAVEVLLGGIGVQPEDPRFYFALSKILLAAKRFQDVKDVLTEMPSGDNHQEMRKAELLGYAEEGQENFEAARTHIEKVLAVNPDHAPALNLKGILAYRNDDRRSAEKYFKRAIDADPGFGEPYTNLGMLSLEADRPQDALKFLERSFRLNPADLDIATNYHSVIAGIAEFEKAENIVREAAALYPNNQKLKYMLVDLLIRQGKYEEAMAGIEAAIVKLGIEDGILTAALKVREKLGPMTIQPTAKKPPVSLCMIIKDEEKYLARCLASVKSVVDEMIVVDTGSKDRSKDIAVTFGAQVYDYDWQDDFAAARNYSISKASGDWILILDGDEVISPLDYDLFNKIVTKKPKAPIAYSVTTRNYNRLANIVGWMPNDGRYPEEEAAIGWLPSEKVRLFYGKNQIWFEGAVHELVDPVLKRNGIEIKKCSIPVHHYGRLDKEKLDRKGEIYFDIGQKKLSEMGEDVNALRELAIQATILEKNQEALDLWQRLLALNPFSGLAAIAYVNMGTIYNRLGKFEDALEAGKKAVEYGPDLKEARYNHAMAELHCGNAHNTISILEDLLNDFPDYPPARFILSAAYCCADQKEKGLGGIRNQKNTPLGAHLEMPCMELGHSLISAGRNKYALCVLGAAIECDIVNKEMLDLFNECIKMNDDNQNLSEIGPTVPKDRQAVVFEHLLQ
jgi:tetratricopeptide (TPR) repeat protein